MQDAAHTVLAAGEASPAPVLLLVILWVPVFAVIAWGLMLLFGGKPYSFEPPDPLVPPRPEPIDDPDQHA
jgi:hypothetical protein